MADLPTSRRVGFLTVLVFCVAVGNVLITLLSVSTVRRSRMDFALTEANFASAVNNAVTNFLYSYVTNYVSSSSPSASSPSFPKCRLEFLPGLVVYYRPFRSSYACRYNGCDFYKGDYFGEGFIRSIKDGRVFVVTPEEEIVIYRPKTPDGVAPATPRRPDEEQAPL